MASASLPHSVSIPLSGESLSIARRSSHLLQDLLLTRFQCEVQLEGLDLDFSESRFSRPRPPPIKPEKRQEFTLSSGVRVSVWKADLTDFKTDAVVNAANSSLQHYGGLAQALSEAGGPSIQKESDDYVEKNGKLQTGDAVALGSGNLNCKRVIHAVGPNLSFKPNSYEVSAAKPQLERVIRRILEIVEKKRLDSVAIPAISSGLFNFPVSECADILVKTVRSFYGSSTSNVFKPKDVFLVNNDEPTVREMERACAAGRSSPSSYSQAVTTTGNRPQTRGAKAGSAPPAIQFGPVRVVLVKGCLEDQTVDVIVNTIGTDRKLSTGKVSQMLLKKAGSELQQEVYSASFSGPLLITKGYGLKCKEVYHTCCPYKSFPGSDQALLTAVQHCLWFAVGTKHRTIAFPAIGTGNLGFSDEEVARIMLNAAWDFGQKSPLPLTVLFVIFPSDTTRFKAFEKELRAWESKAFDQNEAQKAAAENSKPALPPSEEPGFSTSESRSVGPPGSPGPSSPSGPRLVLQSSSRTRLTEAQTWIHNLFNNRFTTVFISNNFCQRLGERDLEELRKTEVEGVQVEEFLEKGRSGFIVSGNTAEDIALTALKLQQLLQQTQTDFMTEEEEEMKSLGLTSQPLVTRVFDSDPQIRRFLQQLQRSGLQLQKVEQVQNVALESVFKLQAADMSGGLVFKQELLQVVSAQFCPLIAHIGLRPEFSPPDDSSLGEGLYFTADVSDALKVWTNHPDAFIYLCVAEVLRGRSKRGRPGLVLPQSLGTGPGLSPGLSPGPGPYLDYVEKSGVTVVFSHFQTLPRFILTCRLATSV